ncbi:MAG: guanylate kinase [Lachnospiraceae bacterium]|nr:guanylate kinase [Lachnospiraceae bacterium]
MGKIIYLMGKSSSGKDTIYKILREEYAEKLKTIVPYTTRPIREGETEGVEYHFTDEEGFQKLQKEGKVIEVRNYQTIHGLWRYFTVFDESRMSPDADYLMIGTLESYEMTARYIAKGKESGHGTLSRFDLLPILLEVEDGLRLERALSRERKEKEPKYEEMCRRFLADNKDFSEENIKRANITRRFSNENLDTCLDQIRSYLKEAQIF